jgi:arylsulfatase A-like enzyme
MGYERDTSPWLDEFSKRCVVFDNIWTPKSLTLPSFTCLFTGLHPTNTGIFQNAWPLDDSVHSLIENFRDSGFNTMGYPCSDILDAEYGINRGFDIYNMAEELPRMAPEEIEAVKSGVESETGPMFLFAHFWETHQPYDPAPEFLRLFADPLYVGQMDGKVETFEAYNAQELPLSNLDVLNAIDRYDGEVRWIDDYLKGLFEYFDEKGLIDNSLIVIAADHGESLSEGHFFGHLRDVNVELQIPLMFHFPGDRAGGLRIDALCENTDILPTVMDILGIEIPEGVDGISMLPLIRGETATHRDKLVSIGAQHEDYFLVSEFDGETRTRLETGLRPSLVNIDEETRERLRSLGYID